MKDLIVKYIKDEVSKLKNYGDYVYLSGVCPYMLGYVLGDFDYELNGYDCDYWARVGNYFISGSMRFGTAEIMYTTLEEEDM